MRCCSGINDRTERRCVSGDSNRTKRGHWQPDDVPEGGELKTCSLLNVGAGLKESVDCRVPAVTAWDELGERGCVSGASDRTRRGHWQPDGRDDVPEGGELETRPLVDVDVGLEESVDCNVPDAAGWTELGGCVDGDG